LLNFERVIAEEHGARHNRRPDQRLTANYFINISGSSHLKHQFQQRGGLTG
jgi:hypothetical protein